jgi:hypothetical protein
MEFTPAFFDASSAAWRANKKRYGQSWRYVREGAVREGAVREGAVREEAIAGHSDKCNVHTTAAVEKLKHGYFLRSRSHHEMR